MIYIKMHGRLGNQFFQYAYARTLALQRHDTITIDFINIEEEAVIDPKGGWENSLRYFQIDPTVKIGKVHYSTSQLLATKLRKQMFRTYRQFDKSPENEVHFEAKAIEKMKAQGILIANGFYDYQNLPQGNLILDGYFESPQYFATAEATIRQEFVPKEPVKKENATLYKDICGSESICVTIRRGDFVYKEGVAKTANICTPEYFYQGIAYIQKQIPQARVVVFSDDIPWVRANMHFPGNTLFESGKDPVWEKMRLMSACKHFVISNSTFSWWAQYLCTNAHKIVVAPSIWRRSGYAAKALYAPDWHLITVS